MLAAHQTKSPSWWRISSLTARCAWGRWAAWTRASAGLHVTVHATGAGNGTEKLLGVVGSTPPHLLSTADREHNYKREDLFVDLDCRWIKCARRCA